MRRALLALQMQVLLSICRTRLYNVLGGSLAIGKRHYAAVALRASRLWLSRLRRRLQLAPTAPLPQSPQTRQIFFFATRTETLTS